MKILLLGMTYFKYMPYMNFFINQIDPQKNEIHIITWNRDNSQDVQVPDGIISHVFSSFIMDTWPLKMKIPKILKYRKYAKKIIKTIDPDFLIVHYSTTAMVLYNDLVRKYKKRYIFDFRDITYENNWLFKKGVERIVLESKITFTSSEGFKIYLPQTPNVLLAHNIDLGDNFADNHHMVKRNNVYPIRIAFWGLLRSYNANLKLIKSLGDDKRFELHYYGRAQGKMSQLMRNTTKKYNNVYYHGEYMPSERSNFYCNTDIINNFFDPGQKTMSLAMSNKFYDGVINHIPQICCKGSFMGKYVSKRGIGLEIDPLSNDIADLIYDYYQGVNCRDFDECCEKVLKKVVIDVKKGQSAIQKIIR